MPSYYRIIDGQRFDRALLELAESLTQGRGDGRVSEGDARTIFAKALDGRRITVVELRTLEYIKANFRLTNAATDYLQRQFGPEDEAFQRAVRGLLREELGLPNLLVDFELAEVRRQVALAEGPAFLDILRAAISALYFEGRSPISFSGIVTWLTGFDDPNAPNPPVPSMRAFLDQGRLRLLPLDFRDRDDLPIAPPTREINLENDWYFVLEIPLPRWRFLRFFVRINRTSALGNSDGYFSPRASVEELLDFVPTTFLMRSDFRSEVDPEEARRQLALQPGQNFGNALYNILDSAIFNGESSLSFFDFLRNEIWLDPERELADVIREYLHNAVLYLLPTDADKQPFPPFPLPEGFSLDPEFWWSFGIAIPDRTIVRYFVTTDRRGDLIDTGFADGFIPEAPNFQARLDRVIQGVYGFDRLETDISEAAVQRQQEAFSPFWDSFDLALSRALNTLLFDYLSPTGFFQTVAERAQIRATDFDSTAAFRAAVRQAANTYLAAGKLTLLAEAIYGLSEAEQQASGRFLPSDQEAIELNWLFQASVPALSDQPFFVVLPRSSGNSYNYRRAPEAAPNILDYWGRYQQWLREHVPDYALRPFGSIEAGELHQLEDVFGASLPDDFRLWYSRLGGEPDDDFFGGYFFGMRLLTPFGMIRERFELIQLVEDGNMNENFSEVIFPENAIQRKYYDPQWMPVFSDDNGNYIGIDLNPGSAGTAGQLITFGADESGLFVIADTLTALWQLIADQIETENLEAAIVEDDVGNKRTFSLRPDSSVSVDLELLAVKKE